MISRLIAFKKQLDDQLVALKEATAPYAGKLPVIAEKWRILKNCIKKRLRRQSLRLWFSGFTMRGKAVF